jgi:hypothetical protein
MTLRGASSMQNLTLLTDQPVLSELAAKKIFFSMTMMELLNHG